MEGGAIWLTTIGTIIVLSALILGVAIMLRRRRRSSK
jgi:cbb3-type cytochrome oxidase subunit 3